MSLDVKSKSTQRRYSEEQRAQAVRLVFKLREELGTDHGTGKRAADQLGYGVESVRSWVHQAEIDKGQRAGLSSDDTERIKALEQEIRELRRANDILKAAASFFGAELDRQSKK